MHSLILVSVAVCGHWFHSPFTLRDGAQGYHFSDPITQVHEDTHGVNALLRNRFGGECFYVGKIFARFRRCHGFTLADVANRCQYRGAIFDLYLVHQRRFWNDQPLYLFDEWVSYANGAQEALGRRDVTRYSDVLYSLEMGYYATMALDLTPSEYADREPLRRFWLWHAKRVVALADHAERTKIAYHPQQRPWRQWLARRIAAESE